MDHLYAEIDGVFARDTKKKKSHEICYAIMYEGWDKNGKRVSLRHPKVIMTTQKYADFGMKFGHSPPIVIRWNIRRLYLEE